MDQHRNNFIEKAKKFRLHFQLTEQELNDLLQNKQLKYIGLERGVKTLTLDLAESIAGIYGLTYCEFKETNQGPPAIKDLPVATKNKVEKKEGNIKVGQKGTRNINENVIVVLSEYSTDDEFTNSQIIAKFPKDLIKHMTGKSIEWNKGILKDLVIDTKETRPTSTNKKPEKIYKLAKKIMPEVREKAQEKIYKNAISLKSEK
ncbi:hypothetical protein ABDJ41_14165 [Pedobacter sp. ASV1-7]|uniref:hypothetical protein n=1 Tax=Pedobacter sp. ASV1-7 TaxID=3145237 RepID=UPI0032E8B7C7